MNIELKNVTKIIHSITVINDVSASLNSGKVYGLCGYNGCGKTMLLRLLAGLILPTTGTISIDGRILGKDISFPPSIGILIENPAFIDRYSGKRNLQLLADIKSIIGTREIEVALSDVGLNPSDSKKYKKYSLGMKQRLGIAAAIMESPELILLDEPTNALDANGIEEITEIVCRERSRGALIVIASHDKDFLQTVSDTIYQIDAGQISSITEKEGRG